MEQRILKAAEECFLELGFTGTTMGRIAKKAGCNPALVHYYYRTKERLFEQVFEEKITLIVTSIIAADEGEGSFEEKVARITGVHFDFLKQNPLFVPFIAGELLSSPERFVAVFEKHGHYPLGLIERLDSELSREVARGAIRKITTMNLITTVMSLNVAPFLILPALRRLTSMPGEAVEAWLEARREENITTVLSRIKL
jgi:AcrR family transcriptional regulator